MNTYNPALRSQYRTESDDRWGDILTRVLVALVGWLLCVPWSFIAASGISRIAGTAPSELLAWGVPHLLLFGFWSGIVAYTIWQTLRILRFGVYPRYDDAAEADAWWQHLTVEARLASWSVGVFFAAALLLAIFSPNGDHVTVLDKFMQREVLEVSFIHFVIASFAALGHRVWVFIRTLEFEG